MPSEDPVVAERARLLRLANLGKRIGYLALAIACVAFVIGALNDLPAWSVVTVITGMAVATVVLVPAIILGYAVAKGEREDPGPAPARSGRP